jgi:hypothetical protein
MDSKSDGMSHGMKDGITEFATYEDYLDSQISEKDRMYLEDEELARQLVELGYKGSGEALKREDFEQKKRDIDARKTREITRKPKELASSVRSDYSHNTLLAALASREEAVRNGKLTSIVFVRVRHPKSGYEVSGYIDYAFRLKEEDFVPYFLGKRKLLPRQSDLSYYNWETQTSTSNPTPNFQVIANNEAGLLFKNKRDRKIINVDPKAPSGDNSSRHEIPIPASQKGVYLQIVIYDHTTRRKS